MNQNFTITGIQDMKALGIDGITLSFEGVSKEQRLRKGQKFQVERTKKTGIIHETTGGEDIGMPSNYFTILTKDFTKNEVKTGDKVIPL